MAVDHYPFDITNGCGSRKVTITSDDNLRAKARSIGWLWPSFILSCDLQDPEDRKSLVEAIARGLDQE